MMADSRRPTLRARSPTQLRALYEAAPSPQLAAALWEIHRLHEVILEAWRRLDKICVQPEAAERAARFGGQILGEEPCVMAHLDAEWLRREEPGTRYHPVKHLLERPYYRPGTPPTDAGQRVSERGAKTSASRQAKAYMEQAEQPRNSSQLTE